MADLELKDLGLSPTMDTPQLKYDIVTYFGPGFLSYVVVAKERPTCLLYIQRIYMKALCNLYSAL